MTGTSTSKPRRYGLDDLYRLRVPSDPQISPDGSQVAFVLTEASRDDDGYRSSIWLVDSDGEAAPRRLTEGKADVAPRWSPDGSRIAFVGKRGDSDKAQICLLDPRGGEARALTSLASGAGAPVWSPDGSAIAFTSAIAVEGDAGDSTPVVTSRLGFKADGAGLIKGKRSHLFTVQVDSVAVESGSTLQLTWGDLSAGGPAWSPDGKQIAFTSATQADRDIEPGSAVHVVAAGGGAPARRTPVAGAASSIAWLPGGQRLLYAGAVGIRVGHAQLLTVEAGGGEPLPVAPGFDRNVMVGAPAYPGAPPQLASDGSTVVFCARDRGCTHVFTVGLAGGQPAKIVGGADRVIGGMSVARSVERIAYVVATPTTPGEIAVAAIDGSGERVLTGLGSAALEGIDLFVPEERAFTASDGTELHGWLLRDPDAPTPAPLLLDIHGGPHNAWNPVFDGSHPYHQELAASGWVVAFINSRGSDGYGEEFYSALTGGWGERDQDDFLSAVDALIAEGIVDGGRLAVTGYSYGGYMTNWLVSQTDRFAAAVPGGSICSLAGEYGTADLGRYLAVQEIGATPHGDPERTARLSPITHVASVTTPCLLLHGERDDRCPISEAEAWFTALRERRVPVELVRYPGANHLFIALGKPSHRIDYARRLIDWISAHTSGSWRDRASSLSFALGGYQSRFDDLARRCKIPGASLAVMDGDDVVSFATGVRSLESGAPVTTDTLFQIGSITKSFTATLVMQLVDEGKVDLDTPVKHYLPELVLGDAEALERITVRHLLNHTSGIQGDYIWGEYGSGEDALERVVADLGALGQVHEVGEMFSYCNTGYAILGRLVEVITAMPWHKALQDRLLARLGVTTMLVKAAEIIRHDAALGHLPGPDGAPALAPDYGVQPAFAAAGSIPAARAVDLLTFARMHLDEGRAADGTEVLSAAAVKQMRERQVDLPTGMGGSTAWGLGWSLGNGEGCFGHGGGTKGQASMLWISPEPRRAVSILTNGPGAAELIKHVGRDLFFGPLGIDPPGQPVALAEQAVVDVARFVGIYESIGGRFEIAAGEDGTSLTLSLTALDPWSPNEASPPLALTACADEVFTGPGGLSVRFLERGADGRFAVLFSGRAARRV